MTKVEFQSLRNEEAIEYFEDKGFAPALARFDWRDVWKDEHDRMFTVAKVMSDDVLAEIKDALDDAIANGIPLEAFKRDIEPKLRAMGWWGKSVMTDPKTGEEKDVQLGSARRLRTIYDTNLRTANAAGRWRRAERNATLMPLLTYIQIKRPTARDEHKPFDGVTLPVGHDFWKTHYPPNGFYCGCMVKQISERVAKRDGLGVTDEANVAKISATEPVEDKRRGVTVDVPIGIDLGFDRNPGLSRHDPGKD